MAEPFVQIEIPTAEGTIYSEEVAKLKELMEAKGFPNWEANEADLAIIILATSAFGTSSFMQIASAMPPAAFRKFGTELVKIAYNEGAAATVTAKFTFAEEGGEFPAHTLEAGIQLTVGEFAFQVKSTTSIAKGESSKNIELVAVERGAEFNGLTGTMQLVNALSFVKEVAIVGETSGGVNQETDEEYQNRLTLALKLQAPRPITATNFAEFALQIPSTKLPTGIVVGRTTAIDGYNPETTEFEGTIEAGHLSEIKEVTSFTGITVKTEIEDAAKLFPAGTLVETIKEGEKILKLTKAASAEHAKEKIKAIGSYENQRTVTVFVAGKKGEKLTTEAMEKIEEYLKEYREINFKISVKPAKYTEIFVTTKIHVLPGYLTATVEENVKKALEQYLSPERWGINPATQLASSWLNITNGFSTVRYNSVLGEIEKVAGVQYVFPSSEGLKIGTGAAPTGTTDIVLAGPAPLTETKPANIVITTG